MLMCTSDAREFLLYGEWRDKAADVLTDDEQQKLDDALTVVDMRLDQLEDIFEERYL